MNNENNLVERLRNPHLLNGLDKLDDDEVDAVRKHFEMQAQRRARRLTAAVITYPLQVLAFSAPQIGFIYLLISPSPQEPSLSLFAAVIIIAVSHVMTFAGYGMGRLVSLMRKDLEKVPDGDA